MKKLSKIFKIAGISADVLLQIVIFIVGVGLVFGASYIVGFRYLGENTLWGNDAYSFYMVVDWFNKNYPNIPFWFPQQAGGTSFVGYPWLAAYIVVLVSKFSSFELAQAFRLVGFLSVPITGVGVIAFVWARVVSIKPGITRVILGVVAALLYVVSPLAWTWLVRWGFYAESISHIFVPWILIFFDLFLEKAVKEKIELGFRLSLFGLVIFWMLGFLTHFFAAVAVGGVMVVLILTKFIFSKEKKVLLKRLLVRFLLLGLFLASVVAWRLYPYSRYNKEVAKAGFSGYGVPGYQEMYNNTVPLSVMLSIERISDNLDPRMTIQDSTFPMYVWILVVPVVVLGWIISKKMWGLSLLVVVGTYLTSSVELRLGMAKIPFLGGILGYIFTGRPFLIPMRVIIPAVAVFGSFVIWEIIGKGLLFLVKKVKAVYYTLLPLKIATVLVLSLMSIGFVVSKYYYQPQELKYFARIGGFHDNFDLRDVWYKKPIQKSLSQEQSDDLSKLDINYQRIVDLGTLKAVCFNDLEFISKYPEVCTGFNNETRESFVPSLDVLLRTQKKCKTEKSSDEVCEAFYMPLIDQLALSNWPKFEISNDLSGEIDSVHTIFSYLPKDKPYRYDLSGFSGRQIMISPIVNPNSMAQIYINTLDLLYSLHNYQSQVMYTTFPLYQKPGVLTQLGKWFGLDYVFLTGDQQEPSDFWQSDSNWSDIGGGWKAFSQPTSLVTWSDKPKVLVIADNKKRLYDQTYRFITWGAIRYDQAMVVQGPKEIDTLSQKEINSYDAIFMRGYDYKFKSSAYSKIDKYIKSGGVMIFDTGWQYNIPDWEVKRAPSWMPFESLSWKILPTDLNWSEEGFAPLVWEDTGWGVSTPGKLKSWAKVEVTYGNTPLVVSGNYGKGSVIWYGFNIVAHAEDKDNLEEVMYFNKILSSLTLNKDSADMTIGYRRINPDHVEFQFTESADYPTGLYFREAYFPDWKAKLITSRGKKNLDITKGGPGMMFIALDKVSKGDILELKIVKSVPQKLLEMLSIISFVALVIYLFFPNVYKKIFKKIDFSKIPKPKFKLKFPAPKHSDEDVNY